MFWKRLACQNRQKSVEGECKIFRHFSQKGACRLLLVLLVKASIIPMTMRPLHLYKFLQK
uniref:Chromatin assembly factor 1 subunit FAS1 isoform X1 n=1 Tax=Rhizophora mucronata TaxID=61149 RepID=A0A2P2K3C7_RHIMU